MRDRKFNARSTLGRLLLGALLALPALAPATTLTPNPALDLEGPGLTLAEGGTGLINLGGGTATVTVDIRGPVARAYFYWMGRDRPCPDSGTELCEVPFQPYLDQELAFNGVPITGRLIGEEAQGGPGNTNNIGYGADVTAIVRAATPFGPTAFSIEDGNLGSNIDRLNGGGLLVIYSDPADPVRYRVSVFEGLDFAFEDGNPILAARVTEPVVFNHGATGTSRQATLVNFVGDAVADRPDRIRVTDGFGVTTTLLDLLVAADGISFDTLSVPVTVPAGSASTSVQLFSEPIGQNPDSLSWLVGALRIPLGAPPPMPAVLGDRVWEDRNNNGRQDCADVNNNGVIGDPGDAGPECNAGVPDVPVTLLAGDCQTPLGQMAVTSAEGFYRFPDLVAGDYCVQFGLPPEGYCETQGYDLGTPVFTRPNVGGNDAIDSDANEDGVTDPIDLAPGERDLTVDAGIVCPAKLGNRVWEDDGNGIQDADEMGIEGVKVTLFGCGPDMIAGTSDDVDTGEMRVTATNGLYMFGGEPGFSLTPGKYFVEFDQSTFPPDFDFTVPGVGGDDVDSDCSPSGGITSCTDLRRSRSINLDRDCGLVPPPVSNCDLLLDKTCRVEAPPPVPFDKCKGKLQQFTVVWTGGPITVSGPANDAPGGAVDTNQEVTFFGPFDQNDVEVFISGSVSGVSEFHMSCSDDDFNDPTDCGKAAGNGKSDDSGLINDWTLEGFIDDDGLVLDCTTPPDGDGFTDNCSFSPRPPPSCENGEKPDTLTWRYNGGTGGDGDCADSTFFTIEDEDGKRHTDFMCSGTIDTSLQITAVDDDGNAFLVNPGESFTTMRDSIKEITLTDSAGATQAFEFHSSCSQPLEAGATAGALTLEALDGRRGGQPVTYRYDVTNLGDPLSDVMVTDNLLGDIGSVAGLGTGGMESFTTTVDLFATTVNTATASGVLADGSLCSPASASDTVTVEVVAPSCDVSIQIDRVEGKKIKWTLTNSGGIDATVEELSIAWPGSESLKKVKLGGSEILKDDVRSAPQTTIVEGDWDKEPKDRRIKDGEQETLEIEFTDDFPLGDNQSPSDFDLSITFEEGCSASF